MGLRIFIGSEKMAPEDASSHGAHHAFVFDGLGGLGGKLRKADNGGQASEAKAASNAAAEALDALVEERWESWAGSLDFSSRARLEDRVRGIVENEISGAMSAALEAAAEKWNAGDGKFPTTIAGWLEFPAPEGKSLAVAVWAGDSRCYTLDASCMKLYSRDDAVEAYRRDAMEDCIYKDSLSMNNRLGRDLDFTLHYSCHIFEGPILLLSCSDGFYHCGESPMHFEYYLRLLGNEETIEEMQKAWTDFILREGRFEDDSATLESIFIHNGPDGVEALRTMLGARLDELKRDYIEPFPEDKGGKSYSDIDACVGTMVKRLCAEGARYRFLEELRANAVRLAMEDSELPADMPCAQAVRQMRSGYLHQKREWREKRAALEERKAQAEGKLDAALRKARLWEASVSWEDPAPSKRVGELLQEKGWKKSFYKVSASQQEIIKEMQRCTYAIRWHVFYLGFWDSGMHSWWELNEWLRLHGQNEATYPADWNMEFPRSRTEAFRKLQQYMVDQCLLANRLAELSQISERLTKVRAGTAKADSHGFELTTIEEKGLKEALIRAADNGSLEAGTMPEHLRRMRLSAWELLEAFSLAAEYVRARRELERFAQGGDAVPEPSAEPFDEYLKFHRNSDARYLIERWLETGERPGCFSLSAELQKVFEKNVCALQKMKADNASIQKTNAELLGQRLALWEKYRLGFEAHGEPFVLAQEPEFTPYAPPVITSQGGDAERGMGENAGTGAKDGYAAWMREAGSAGAPEEGQPAPAEAAQGPEAAGGEGAWHSGQS